MKEGLFNKAASSSVTMLVYGIRGSNPPRYALYDVDNVEEGRRRIESRHPEYVYLGHEIMLGRADAKDLARAVNKVMDIYPDLLEKYPHSK